MYVNKFYTSIIAIFSFLAIINTKAQDLPKSTTYLVKKQANVKVYTLVAPNEMFANATHVIELPTQLIVVDGHFFAQYGAELKKLTDSLSKPVTRFYISHDHPDHYLGFGDAFPNVKVYALREIKENIEKNGARELKEKQQQFGNGIAKKLNVPTIEVIPGKEIIDGTTLVFEKTRNAESPVSLTIKLPELGVYIAQDIVYNGIHLFITGPTDGWKKALNTILKEKKYDIILGGHGKPANKKILAENIQYLTTVDKILKTSKTKESYKAQLLAAYPNYAGNVLIDIYSNFLFK